MNEKDIKKLGKVALVYGGTSAEREISLQSGAAVAAALKNLNVEHVEIDLQNNLVESLDGQSIDRVFVILHGPGGEDGTLQGALETLGFPYTGSGVLASALAMDKIRTKQLWQGIGLPTAKFMLLDKSLGSKVDWDTALAELGGKAMVKPATEGSSIGMSVASTGAELEKAYHVACQYDAAVMAEQWIEGNEYTIAILGGVALPVIKLETDRIFYDFAAKYERDDTRYICPCGLDKDIEVQLQRLAESAFNSLGCYGWGRVDVMQDQNGDFYFLEVNTIPGMTDHSLVPMAARESGMNFEDLVFKILELSL